MMTATAGKLIAIQAEDGQVYMGIVTWVDENGHCTVDVIADHTYRGAAVGRP